MNGITLNRHTFAQVNHGVVQSFGRRYSRPHGGYARQHDALFPLRKNRSADILSPTISLDGDKREKGYTSHAGNPRIGKSRFPEAPMNSFMFALNHFEATLFALDDNNGSRVFTRNSDQPPGGRRIVRATQVNPLGPIEILKR